MKENIASYIDHTLLKPAIALTDVRELCKEAIAFGFAAVCIPPFVVKEAAGCLAGTSVKVATVAGFPLGYSSAASKLTEIGQSILDGADELDIVINLIALKSGEWDYLIKEMIPLVEKIHENGKIIKVIVESGLLTRDELYRCCDIYGGLGIDFMKTSTGYAEKGASISDVVLMKKQLPSNVKIKASGGIRHFAFASELVEAGAERLGCSSSLQILEEEKQLLKKAK